MIVDHLESLCRRYEVNFDAYGLRLRCSCDSQEAVNILLGTFGAFVVAQGGDLGTPDTEVVVGTTSIAADAARALDPGVEAEHLVLVGYPSRGERARMKRRGDWTIIVSDLAVTYAVNQGRRLVIITSPPNQNLIVSLVRLLRRILDPAMLERGAMRSHAAAMVIGEDDVVAFCGTAGAGKTTLLLGLAKVCGARLLAFDKLFLWPSDGQVSCAGVPGALGVGIGTARHLRLFADQFSVNEGVDPGPLWQRTNPGEKARVPVTALRSSFAMAPGSHLLRTLIFPHLSQGSALIVRKLPVEEGIDRLLQQSFGTQLSSYEQDWLGLEPAPLPRLDEPSFPKVLTLLRTQIRYWDVQFGDQMPEELAASLSLQLRQTGHEEN